MEKVLTLFLCDCLFPLCYFYHGQEWDINISSLLRLLLKVRIWYRLNNNIEKNYHHDGEQQLYFHKNIQIYRSSKKKKLEMLYFYVLLRKTHYNKWKICLFDENRTQDNVKCHIWKEWSWQINRYWTGTLQVTLLFVSSIKVTIPAHFKWVQRWKNPFISI